MECRGLVGYPSRYFKAHGDEGFAYKLSDIVAWANNKGKEPKGVISIDVTDKIKTKLRYDFE